MLRHCGFPFTPSVPKKHSILGSQPQVICSKCLSISILKKYKDECPLTLGRMSCQNQIVLTHYIWFQNQCGFDYASWERKLTSSRTLLSLPLKITMVVFGSLQRTPKTSCRWGCKRSFISLICSGPLLPGPSTWVVIVALNPYNP